MTLEELDTMVLDRDLPDLGLRRGDLGSVVHTYPHEEVEVELVTASGETQALVTLQVSDLRPVGDRPVGDRDPISVRPLDHGVA